MIRNSFLRPYKNPVIFIPVRPKWAIDTEAYGRWLAKQDKENRNFGWATTRRICLLAFASYYGAGEKSIRDQFIDKHERFARFPTKYDYDIDGEKVKIASSSVNEKWNIGSTLSAKITENAFKKGADLYIFMTYNVDCIYIVGWSSRDTLKMFKEANYYVMREAKVSPMHEHEYLKSIDTRNWYR